MVLFHSHNAMRKPLAEEDRMKKEKALMPVGLDAIVICFILILIFQVPLIAVLFLFEVFLGFYVQCHILRGLW